MVMLLAPPLSDRFIGIKYDGGGSVVHHDCAPQRNLRRLITKP